MNIQQLIRRFAISFRDECLLLQLHRIYFSDESAPPPTLPITAITFWRFTIELVRPTPKNKVTTPFFFSSYFLIFFFPYDDLVMAPKDIWGKCPPFSSCQKCRFTNLLQFRFIFVLFLFFFFNFVFCF